MSRRDDLQAGELDQRVSLERPLASQGGDEVAEWLPISTVWASMEILRGQERPAGATDASVQYKRFRVRYRPDLDSVKRLVHRGIVHDIDDIGDPTGSRKVLEIVCRVVQ